MYSLFIIFLFFYLIFNIITHGDNCASETNSSIAHEEAESSNKLKVKDNMHLKKCFPHFISSFISSFTE